MNKESKLVLSADELQLVNNRDWILTKRVVMDKINSFMGELATKQKIILTKQKDFIPQEVLATDAKIAKGENYLQLPFLILDYPRYFKEENIFAVRTMFWWGNFFSVTMQLSGKYKLRYQQNLVDKYDEIKRSGFYLNVHENQWHHHFEIDNYKIVNDITKEEMASILAKKEFLKMAKMFPL
ncbi:MAG TPA: hypothetical protein PK987_13155, partial [Ferruginibacter sp.]|nr:hypothetical protein [Ferruginibacter sp.]